MNSYQIVSESANLAEGFGGLSLAITAGGFGLWYLNRGIRTRKILNRYPTPADLRAKLEQHPNQTIRNLAAELSDDMTPMAYQEWVATKTNPKMGVGKAILMFLFGHINFLVQGGKAAIHASEDSDTILNRAINNGRMYQ